MSATCIYRIWVRQSNKLNVLPGIGYLTTRDLEQFQKIKVKYFKDTFPEKKDIILITPWWHSSFLQGKRRKTRVACLKSGVMFKGKASFKACLFGRIPVSILDLGCFAFVTTEYMNYGKWILQQYWRELRRTRGPHIFTGKPLPKKNFGIIKNPHAQSLRPLLNGEESGNRDAQINKLFPRLLKNQLVDKNLIQT